MLRRSLLISAFAASLAFAIPAQAAPVKTLKIGVTAGTHAEILRAALPIAKKNGLDIKVIEFPSLSKYFLIANQEGTEKINGHPISARKEKSNPRENPFQGDYG